MATLLSVICRLTLIIVIQLTFIGGVAAKNIRPNIVYLMADDLGYGDLTPERMPRTYALREQLGTELKFYTMQNCASTRAALMTGKHPSDLGIVGVNSPPHFDGVQQEEILFPEILQQHGYRTAVFGKWHLGLKEEQSPLNNGFDEFLGFSHGWINYYGSQSTGLAYSDGSLGHDHHSKHDLQINGVPLYNSSYSTFLFSQASQQFIRKQAAKDKEGASENPFFLYIPFNAPHGPYASPKKYAELLKDDFGIDQETFDLLHEYENEILAIPYDNTMDRETELRLFELLYYGSVRAMDDAIADIYETLVATGEADNTLFMFASDNGAGVGGGGLPGDNGIFRAGKGSPYEGGHRVPNLLIWPERIPQKHQVGFNIWVGDLFRTFLAAAEIPYQNEELASNNILSPLLEGSQRYLREHGGQHIVSHISKLTVGTTDLAIFALNNAHQKYIRAVRIDLETDEILSTREELYDLNDDPGETNNLLNDARYGLALDRMRLKYNRFGGDEYLVEMPTTRRGGWADFTLPQEWGFPDRVFESHDLLYSDVF